MTISVRPHLRRLVQGTEAGGADALVHVACYRCAVERRVAPGKRWKHYLGSARNLTFCWSSIWRYLHHGRASGLRPTCVASVGAWARRVPRGALPRRA